MEVILRSSNEPEIPIDSIPAKLVTMEVCSIYGTSKITDLNDFYRVRFADLVSILKENQLNGTFDNVPEEIRAD
jgi:hypothetical protein